MDKFVDIRSLVFDGYLKTTIKIEDKIIVIKTLKISEEDAIIEKYKHFSNEYNLMAIIDTIERAVHSINSCEITEESRKLVRDWPKKLIIKLFDEYAKLAKRIRVATKLIIDFVDTEESRQHWSVIKMTKTSFNSSTITGGIYQSLREVSPIQRVWIYLNEQEEINSNHKLEWSRVEYMTESICSFVNPKAMQQITNKRKLEKEEENRKKMIDEIKKEKGDKVIENTADDLFKAIKKRPGESQLDYAKRTREAVMNTLKEDEHDLIVRLNEEYDFARRLRIKKENARRIKEKRKNIKPKIIIDNQTGPEIVYRKNNTRPLPNGIVVGMEQNLNLSGENENKKEIKIGLDLNVTLGDDDNFKARIDEQEKNNPFYLNGIDYADVVRIKSFELLVNKDKIFNQVVNETDEETIKWIDIYIQNEQEETEVAQKIRDLLASQGLDSTVGLKSDDYLSRREIVLTGGEILEDTGNSFEDRQAKMKAQIQTDSIQFGGNK